MNLVMENRNLLHQRTNHKSIYEFETPETHTARHIAENYLFAIIIRLIFLHIKEFLHEYL